MRLPKQKEEEIEQKVTQEKKKENINEKPSTSTVVEDNIQLSEDSASSDAMTIANETTESEKQKEPETVSEKEETSLKEKEQQELDAFEKELLQ